MLAVSGDGWFVGTWHIYTCPSRPQSRTGSRLAQGSARGPPGYRITWDNEKILEIPINKRQYQ